MAFTYAVQHSTYAHFTWKPTHDGRDSYLAFWYLGVGLIAFLAFAVFWVEDVFRRLCTDYEIMSSFMIGVFFL